MKANELRINNLVYYNNKHKEIGRVTGLQSTVTIQCYVFIDNRAKSVLDLDMIQPIPLTDEWLFKFGFIKQKNYRKVRNGVSKYDWSRDNIHYFSIEKHHFGDYDEGQTFYPTFRFGNIFIPLSTVHQLQNLYFTLSGEDLILNKDK